MKNSISFYLQFVHYSNNELDNIKQFIYENMSELKCHLISNESFNKLFHIKNTVGKFLYVEAFYNTIVNINKILNIIPTIKNKFSQLNLLFIRIKFLFLTPSILGSFIKKIQIFKSISIRKYVFNFTLNSNYSLFWARINNFHIKYFLFFKIIQFCSMRSQKLFLYNYI